MAQNVAQHIFRKNLYIYLAPWKTSSPTKWSTFVIFSETPKVNNCPMGENSPNLFTLLNSDPDLNLSNPIRLDFSEAFNLK
jgi:hypothetical protein